MSLNDLENKLKNILRLRTGSNNILQNRESTQLEFKKTFNLGSASKYTKTMAAFANNKGGYIVFGVLPSPHKLVGINKDNFLDTDSAKISTFLNAYFSPEIDWEMGIVHFHIYDLGFLYTYPARDKPVVSIKSDSSDLKDGDIYYRYSGQTRTIRYSELRVILEERVTRERNAWMQQLKRISNAGATNVAIIDTLQGKVFGAGAPFVVDEKLLRELKFVKEGSFSETDGLPTLKLVGEMRSISGVTVEKTIPQSIHFEDLVTAFLGQRDLDLDVAKIYLREASYQPTHYVPLYYFISKAQLNKEEAITLIQSTQSGFKETNKKLSKRILNPSIPIGMFPVSQPRLRIKQPVDKEAFKDSVASVSISKNKRTLILGMLRQNPSLVLSVLSHLPRVRVLEAVIHLGKSDLDQFKSHYFDILMQIFTTGFATMSSVEKSVFRKAICHIDEVLYYSKIKK